ncbi:MAG: hypothetical protein JOY51_04130 [Nevskia sp.]|nr:hypothetical protein [Nevskia sp.]
MPSPQSAKLADFLASMRRRRRPMLYAFAAVLALSVLSAILWPPTYRAIGTILIEQQELPPDLVRAAVTSFADQRIQVITQRVMTTENLFKIIERYDLYPRLRQTEPRDKIIRRMRDDISFEMISADVIDPRVGRPTKATIAFSVSYSNRSPELAARVANELVSLYLRVNIESRKEDAANAADFMSDEAERLSKHIDELQAQMAAFKQQHLNSLPDQAAFNSTLLFHAQDELREADTQIRSLDQQQTYLEAQLAQIYPNSQVFTSTGERVLSPADRLKFLRTEYARVSGLYAPDHPDVLRLKREIAGLEATTGNVDASGDLERRLQATQSDLAAAKQKYSIGHPDIVRLSKQVETLKQQLAQASASAVPVAPGSAINPDNPAYIQIKAQLEGAQAQHASWVRKRGEIDARLAELQARMAQTPGVERDYAELARDLDNARTSYNQIRQKQVDAKVSQNLEDEHRGERFTLIEPPVPPEQPASPNRLAILVVGLLLSLAAAAAALLLTENLDDSVRDRKDLEALLTVPPLAVLPHIETAEDRRRQTRRQRYAWAGLVASLALVLGLTHFFYRPLDVLWHVAIRHLGG